jgi:FAD/FMN-containing dehydrogenase
MNAVRIDAQAQTAYVEAGVEWGAVLEKAQEVGLAPLLGSSPNVGVVGYTLGGGFGWLGRKYGLAIDKVRYFDVVTAAGEQLRASAAENTDLFWGMRGGGGGLAIVTGLEFGLVPLTTVYAGNLLYPIEDAREVFAHYREWIASAPDELTSSMVIMNFPPLPVVPEFLRGRSFAIVRGCYCGAAESGEALLSFWRSWRKPEIDFFGPIPFSAAATISNDPADPTPGTPSGAWFSDISDETIDILLRYSTAEQGPPPLIMSEVRHAGGAISRAAAEATAYGNRDKELIWNMVAMTPTPEMKAQAEAHIRRFKDALAPHMTGGVYMNFLDWREAAELVRRGFSPESFARLEALKAKYDPQNLLAHGIPIGPSA